MAEVIFKKGMCLKGEIYSKIKEWLLEGGWENISSNPDYALAANDADVFYSKGKNGQRNLLLNLRPTPANGAIASSIETSTTNVMSYRLQNSYEPNEEEGVNGTFGRPSLAWTAFYIFPATTAIGIDATVTYYYHCDKNRLIFTLEYSRAYGVGSVVCYLGIPEEEDIYATSSDSRAMLVATSTYATAATSVQVANTPDEMASVAAPYALATYASSLISDPTIDEIKIIFPVLYGSATESYRGLLSDIFVMNANKTNLGDLIEIPQADGETIHTYRAFICQSASNNSFPSLAIALRIS